MYNFSSMCSFIIVRTVSCQVTDCTLGCSGYDALHALQASVNLISCENSMNRYTIKYISSRLLVALQNR